MTSSKSDKVVFIWQNTVLYIYLHQSCTSEFAIISPIKQTKLQLLAELAYLSTLFILPLACTNSKRIIMCANKLPFMTMVLEGWNLVCLMADMMVNHYMFSASNIYSVLYLPLSSNMYEQQIVTGGQGVNVINNSYQKQKEGSNMLSSLVLCDLRHRPTIGLEFSMFSYVALQQHCIYKNSGNIVIPGFMEGQDISHLSSAHSRWSH